MSVQVQLPTVPAPFHWTSDKSLSIELGRAVAQFSTKLGGISTGNYAELNVGLLTDDEPNSVQENRRRLAGSIGRTTDQLLQGNQVHGSDVVWTERDTDLSSEFVDSDGQATNDPERVATVVVADCLPIAVAGERSVAVLHGGWRGLAAQIIDRGVELLRAHGETDFIAAIGPGISCEHFEAGSEVHAAFADVPGATVGTHVDLKRVAAHKLAGAGVGTVHDCGLCTYAASGGTDEKLFYSYRRDAGITGRQAGMAWLQ